MPVDSQAEIEKIKARNQGKKIDGIADTIQTFIKYSVYLGIFYIIFLIVQQLSGKFTFADIRACFEIVFNDGTNGPKHNVSFQSLFLWLFGLIGGWAVGACGFIYGKRQMRLRARTIDRLQGRIVELEKFYDPNRSSSAYAIKRETQDDSD